MRSNAGFTRSRTARVISSIALVAAVSAFSAASASAAKDYASTALNIIPSGQYGGFPVPAGADEQALMYDGLTPLFDRVTNSDLSKYFKSEALGSLGTDGPGTVEETANADVTITRDRFNVPHVDAKTYDAGIWAAGWIAAADRGLLLAQARYNARVAAIDAPGLSAIGLVSSLQNFQPSEQTEAVVAKQADVLMRKGKEGRKVLADIDTFIAGINAYYDAHSPSTAPFTRNDIFALNALKNQFLGTGGGDEARRSQFLGGLQDRLGDKRGFKVFNDLRQFKNKDNPVSIDGKFKYGSIPKKHPGSAVLDHGSFTTSPAVAPRALPRKYHEFVENEQVQQASNTLMITKDRSTTGKPLMVGGPQIGYFYPGLTYEIDMKAPGLNWRGATSAPFPGYLLIGRGEDFATTLTSAGADVIDQFAEKLCGGSDTKYRYNGKCREMGDFDAGTLNGDPVSFKTTVHGPVIGYATVDGKRVALSYQRSSYGQDTVDLLFNRRLSTGQVKSPKTFFKAAAKTPQTFNSFYIDNKHVAMFTSGKLPKRSRKVDPGLPTWGTGKFEWRGFLDKKQHMHGADPRDGTMTNWNNISARGFGAADDQWGGNGSAARVDMLDKNLKRLANKRGKWSMAAVTSAMNAAGTQDVRAIDTVPLLSKVLKGSQPPSERASQMLGLLKQWRAEGGSRLDMDLDGKIDAPGAAVMDGSWDAVADAIMQPWLGDQLDELDSLFNRFDLPPSGQYSGWYQYFDRDARSLLGKKVKQPLKMSYCGKGKLKACQKAIWGALEASGAEIAAEQGSENPADWRSDAVRERIGFSPGLLPTTMRYTNRPTGIQQVISFKGHR